MKLVSIILLGIGLLFLGIYFLLLVLFKNKEVSLSNSFGYEIYSSLSADKRFTLYFLLLVFSGLTGTGIYMGLSIFKSLYLNIISITFIVGFLLTCVSNIIPLSIYKYHIICYFAGIGLISSSSLLFFIGKINNELILDNNLISLPISVVFLLLSVTLLIFLANPNNSSFYKLVKVEKNGNTSYEKPKVNYLALEEWSSLVIMGIMNLLFLVQLFIIY